MASLHSGLARAGHPTTAGVVAGLLMAGSALCCDDLSIHAMYSGDGAPECRWDVAITPDDPGAPFSVSRLPTVARWERLYRAMLHNGRDFAVVVPPSIVPDHEADDVANEIARIWARLPPLVHASMPPGLKLWLEPGLDGLGFACGERIGIGFNPDHHARWVADGWLYPGFEEALLHEAGHMMHCDLPRWYDDDKWRAAVAADQWTYVSDYAAANNVEDFAESFVAWVVIRAYAARIHPSLRRHIRAAIPHRLRYFDARLREAAFRHWPLEGGASYRHNHQAAMPHADMFGMP